MLRIDSCLLNILVYHQIHFNSMSTVKCRTEEVVYINAFPHCMLHIYSHR